MHLERSIEPSIGCGGSSTAHADEVEKVNNFHNNLDIPVPTDCFGILTDSRKLSKRQVKLLLVHIRKSHCRNPPLMSKV
jgi:hypothetical protein